MSVVDAHARHYMVVQKETIPSRLLKEVPFAVNVESFACMRCFDSHGTDEWPSPDGCGSGESCELACGCFSPPIFVVR